MANLQIRRLATHSLFSWERCVELARFRDSIAVQPLDDGSLAMPLLLDDTFTPVGVHLSWDEDEKGEGGVLLHCEGADEDTAARAAAQVEQILCLDVTAEEAAAFEDVLGRDDVLAAVHARRAGMLPLLFVTVYQSCVWSIFTARSSMRQARSLWRDYSEEHGLDVTIAGRTYRTFPPPAFFLEGHELPGLRRQKWKYLEDVARAALSGHLNRDRLREMELDAIKKELRKVQGIGPYFADLVSAFGVGHRDVFMEHETRIHEAMGVRYGVEASDMHAIHQISDGWRPLRTWGSYLIMIDAMLGG